ncbi:MAG: GNAT family N-acetyltransferase [Actinomycetota bacterium]|nr:GNAT family N-acetyltransferase [Actinomycetota bacterium]
MTLATPAVTAAEVVDRTARRTGVQIRELDTPGATVQGADVLRAVWGSVETIAPSNLLRAVQHTGGYVFGVYDDNGAMLAASVGLLASEGLHSHITGVVPAGQRRGLGFALKQHQRAWALERGITTISWTTDPLVRRNVAFNLHALGAHVVAYLPDHYGPMNDGLNRSDETDRLELHWDLLSPSAVDAEKGRLPWAVSDAPHAVALGPGDLPVLDSVGSGSRRVQLPPEIEAIRRTDPEVARAWRLAVRDAVLAGLSAGAAITGLTAEGALVMEVNA